MATSGAKNQAASELGKLGAAATNKKLTAAERRKNARRAALARWAKTPKSVRTRGQSPDQSPLFPPPVTEANGRRKRGAA